MIAVILPILFILFRNGESEDAEKEDNINMEKSRKEEINDLTKEGEEGREYPNTGTGSMELEEKIELTDYVELSIEDFLRETGVPLHQKKDNKNVWISEDNVLWVGTINGQVAYISISQLTGNKEIKKKIAQEGYPYMIAGISLNDEMSDLYDTVLKNASYGWGDGGYYYYSDNLNANESTEGLGVNLVNSHIISEIENNNIQDKFNIIVVVEYMEV